MLINISGLPGIGKTTLIKKLVEYLVERNANVQGFFTEEIRDSKGNREGFDIVTLKNERAVFARKRGLHSPFKVASYSVDIKQFENLVLPLFVDPGDIMIIDEIGKMELFSEEFKKSVVDLVDNSNVTVVATIPIKGNDEFIKDLKRKSTKIINVQRNNRDFLLQEIIKLLSIN